MCSETEGARKERALSPTHNLAYFLWYNILGNEGDAWSDINFKRRILSNAKRVLKEGADLETIKLALTIMRDDGIMPHSPQQAIDWTRKGAGGKSFYQVAEEQIKQQEQQPPIWDTIAYAEWQVKRDSKLHRTTEDSRLQSDS